MDGFCEQGNGCRFGVFMAAPMKNAVFWEGMILCGSCKNQWRYCCKRLSSPSAVRYILAANQGGSKSFTLKMEVICSSDITRTTWHHHFLEEIILQGNKSSVSIKHQEVLM
jgi:hypothetical protein